MAEWKARASGAAPAAGESWVQLGVPPAPLALSSTQISALGSKGHPSISPPNTIMRLFAPSYTAVWPSRTVGSAPAGVSCVQVGGPPRPLALASTQTSLLCAEQLPMERSPPKMVILLVLGS